MNHMTVTISFGVCVGSDRHKGDPRDIARKYLAYSHKDLAELAGENDEKDARQLLTALATGLARTSFYCQTAWRDLDRWCWSSEVRGYRIDMASILYFIEDVLREVTDEVLVILEYEGSYPYVHISRYSHEEGKLVVRRTGGEA
jgi:hypothetical protein